jgi:hypothetical protein
MRIGCLSNRLTSQRSAPITASELTFCASVGTKIGARTFGYATRRWASG